jgi:hypothetical protein
LLKILFLQRLARPAPVVSRVEPERLDTDVPQPIGNDGGGRGEKIRIAILSLRSSMPM